ncbi:MAG: 50S ribosomal protein L17 [Proteobacteria bacterium]|nr:50S ribosomal protein L17 [Pseudomonadota bacterium]
MRHRIAGRKFSRTSSQRRALLSGLAFSLLDKEQIKTTLPKAKDLRPYVEKLITLGKDGSLSARRRLVGILHSETLASKLIDSIAPRYKERNGGYTRIIKAGFRYGDLAPMAVIELLDRDPSAKANPQAAVEVEAEIAAS